MIAQIPEVVNQISGELRKSRGYRSKTGYGDVPIFTLTNYCTRTYLIIRTICAGFIFRLGRILLFADAIGNNQNIILNLPQIILGKPMAADSAGF